MSRKDYELIARVLSRHHTHSRSFEATCIDMAGELQALNSRFDRSRFLTACGLSRREPVQGIPMRNMHDLDRL